MSVNVIGSQPPVAGPTAATGSSLGKNLLGVAGVAAAPSAFATIASIVQQANASTDVTRLAAPAPPTAASAAKTAAAVTAGTNTAGALGQQIADARGTGAHVHHGHRHGGGKSGGVTDTGSGRTASFLNWLAASNTSSTRGPDGSAPLLDISA